MYSCRESVSTRLSSMLLFFDMCPAFLADRRREHKDDGALPQSFSNGGFHALVLRVLELFLAGAALQPRVPASAASQSAFDEVGERAHHLDGHVVDAVWWRGG